MSRTRTTSSVLGLLGLLAALATAAPAAHASEHCPVWDRAVSMQPQPLLNPQPLPPMCR